VHKDSAIHAPADTTVLEDLQSHHAVQVRTRHHNSLNALSATQVSIIQQQVNRRILVQTAEMATGQLLVDHRHVQMYVEQVTTVREELNQHVVLASTQHRQQYQQTHSVLILVLQASIIQQQVSRRILA